jgi:hypothetical protein
VYSRLQWLFLICLLLENICSSGFSSADEKKLWDKNPIYGIDFKFGMPTSDPRFEAVRKSMYETAVKYGATITRSGVGWAEVEAVKGQPYNWDKLDRKLIWLAEHGLPSCLNIATAPEWAIEPSPEIKEIFRKANAEYLLCQMSIKASHWPFYEKYITEMVKRCGRFVTYYDIWNEPDGMGNPSVYLDESGKPTAIKFGGDPKWYVDLLKHTTPILRKLDPDCVIGAGCLENKNQPTSEFLEEVYRLGGQSYFDAISIHPYGKPLNFEWLRAVRRVMVSNGDANKPVWITEYGLNWQRSDGITEEAAAALTRAALRYMRETPWITMGLLHHAGPILWYQNSDNPADLRPKPALIAFKETKEEGGPKPSFTMGLEKEHDLTYWYYEVDGSKDMYPYLTITEQDYHTGKKSLSAKTDGYWIKPFVSVNVKTKSPTLTLWYKIASTTPKAEPQLSIEVRPGNLDIPFKTITIADKPKNSEWTKVELLLAKEFPEVADKTIVDIGFLVQMDKPGFTLYLDDISLK